MFGVNWFISLPLVKLICLSIGVYFWVTATPVVLGATAAGLLLHYLGCLFYGFYIGDVIGDYIVKRWYP